MDEKSQKVFIAKCVDLTLRLTELVKENEANGDSPETAAEKAFDAMKEEHGMDEGQLAFAINTGFAFADRLQSLNLKPDA